MNMITDRTSLDVARWRELHDKGWEAMTEAERAEWLSPMKGRYNHTDMNRVESAVKALSDRFLDLGYLATPLTVKTNWTGADAPTFEDFERYFGNVRRLRSLIPVHSDTPIAPTVHQKLNYERANDLEKILVDIDEISKMVNQFRYFAGEIYSGEV